MEPTLGHPTPNAVIGADVILDCLGTQVHHLVKAELTAIDGCCLWFQGNDQLLWVFTGHQSSLREEKTQTGKQPFNLKYRALSFSSSPYIGHNSNMFNMSLVLQRPTVVVVSIVDFVSVSTVSEL